MHVFPSFLPAVSPRCLAASKAKIPWKEALVEILHSFGYLRVPAASSYIIHVNLNLVFFHNHCFICFRGLSICPRCLSVKVIVHLQIAWCWAFLLHIHHIVVTSSARCGTRPFVSEAPRYNHTYPFHVFNSCLDQPHESFDRIRLHSDLCVCLGKLSHCFSPCD